MTFSEICGGWGRIAMLSSCRDTARVGWGIAIRSGGGSGFLSIKRRILIVEIPRIVPS